MANYDSLKNRAIEIRDEKRAGCNTANRVGSVMYDLAAAIESVDKGGSVDVATIANQMTKRSATIVATQDGTLILKEEYRALILGNRERIDALEGNDISLRLSGVLKINENDDIVLSIGSGLQEDTGKKLGLKLSTALVFDTDTGAVGVDVAKLKTLLGF